MDTFSATTYITDALFSDLHKDAYGYRPTGDQYTAWRAMSEIELNAEHDRMLADLAYALDCERAEQEAATIDFENLVTKMIECGAKTRERAIRWIIAGEGAEEDVEMYGFGALEYRMNLKYGYLSS